MIKIIDGNRYNTATAKLVYSWSHSHPSDFHYREKTLYHTRKGAWFLYHEGGALSDMAVSVGNNGTGGSSNIEVLTAKDAYQFLESHSDDSDAAEAIEAHFADYFVDA